MACLPLPDPPALPDISPITIAPTLPDPAIDPALCCKIPGLPTVPGLIQLPPGVFSPVVATLIDEALDQVSLLKDAFPLRCAKE